MQNPTAAVMPTRVKRLPGHPVPREFMGLHGHLDDGKKLLRPCGRRSF